MGDGPAYDFHYARATEAVERKSKKQQQRTTALHEILSTVGFGENDGNLSVLEQEAARHLRLAYDLFATISR